MATQKPEVAMFRRKSDDVEFAANPDTEAFDRMATEVNADGERIFERIDSARRRKNQEDIRGTLEKAKVDDLRELARERLIDDTGTKAELVDRLEVALEAEEDQIETGVRKPDES